MEVAKCPSPLIYISLKATINFPVSFVRVTQHLTLENFDIRKVFIYR